jgi:hypothetical protein
MGPKSRKNYRDYYFNAILTYMYFCSDTLTPEIIADYVKSPSEVNEDLVLRFLDLDSEDFVNKPINGD